MAEHPEEEKPKVEVQVLAAELRMMNLRRFKRNSTTNLAIDRTARGVYFVANG